MKREGTIGAAALLTILAAVGISLQPNSKPYEAGRLNRDNSAKVARPPATKAMRDKGQPWCSSLEEQLEDFLDITELSLPSHCYDSRSPGSSKHVQAEIAQKTSKLKFVIALLPDPVHTHLSVLFDQFAVAVQDGAQDEKYDFDGSWLPWDDQETSYAHLADEWAADEEKRLKEDEPGIILFRKSAACLTKPAEECKNELARSYPEGLIVFVVGEEATDGIHRKQFRNALQWIAALDPSLPVDGKQLAILGPTFSGSLPSLEQVLSEPDISKQLLDDVQSSDQLALNKKGEQPRLAIYSGSVSSQQAAESFQTAFSPQLVFHSFVQNDDEILKRFSEYMCREQGSGFNRVAILSEDETAYGGRGVADKTACGMEPLRLYYPRDISALRGAYQTKSLFDAGVPSQSQDTQRRNLPSDLADPAGKVHDSIRSINCAFVLAVVEVAGDNCQNVMIS